MKMFRPQKGSPIFLLPSLITISAMCAGFCAIIASTKNHYTFAYHLTLLAMVLDSLDGRVARFTHTVSPFGAQMDSLSDMLNFGIAPALIVYNWHLGTITRIGSIIAFIYTVCAALRLARFNVMLDTDMNKKYFIGLPSTAAAPIVVGYVWLCQYFDLNNKYFVILGVFVVLLSAFSMVSNINFYSFKELHVNQRARFKVLLLCVVCLILLAIFPELMIFIALVSYTIISYILHFISQRKLKTV